jgi:sigma-B regulation protein RsbU (phosphoserine phosphatase)
LGGSGEIGELAAGGTALGLLESFPYEEEEVPMMPGDLLVMYSDGITEAMNSSSDQFGRTNLDRILVEQRHLPLDDLARMIVEAVKEHAGSAPQSDDITLVAVRRTAL